MFTKLKEALKRNKAVYKILKPIVDLCRICVFTIRGGFVKIGLYKTENIQKLVSYKNKHKGERCFLVTNGPSLTMDDLNKIKNETSIGCNRIFSIFDKTEWRPNMWCVIDENIMDTVVPFVPKNTPMFSTKSAYNKLTNHNRDIIYVEDLYLDKHFAKVANELYGWCVHVGISNIYGI